MSYKVIWLPAHPSYGAVSMAKYAALLEDERRTDDTFSCKSLLSTDIGPRRGKVARALQRHLLYPWKVRRSTGGGRIAHVLDHSWCDLLRYVPRGVKTVVTVHDLIPLRFPGELSPGQVARFRSWVEFVRTADAVIAVSEYTKGEVSDLLGVDPSRIFVVPNGASSPPTGTPVPTRISKKLEGLKDRFLVGSLGSTLERKNLAVLPGALAKFQEATGRAVTLVRAGGMLSEALRLRCAKALGEGGLVEFGMVDDSELEDFYHQVDCVAVPSLYEGFGLPVLEAMARATPVVAAKASSLPEVGGDAALYFDPESEDSLASSLARLLDPEVRADLIPRGVERAARFTWRNTLEGFYDIYRRLLE